MNISGATNSTYRIASVQTNDAAAYSVVVGSTLGTATSAVATLTTVPGPAANLVWINPGTFTMGSPGTELDRLADEGPQHLVTLTRGFWIGKYEVTQTEFASVYGSNPGATDGNPQLPARGVTWLECLRYCDLLTEAERAAGRLPAGFTYRLPTEAEWEYACRAGTTTRFSHGDDPAYAQLGDYAWLDGNTVAPHFPQPVGLKQPNTWGLYDMHGNVSEYCLDWLGSYTAGAQSNPSGVGIGINRVVRGGNSFGPAASCRSAGYRGGVPPDGRNYGCGLRVVLVAKPQTTTLARIGFEAAEGYVVGQPIVGRQGWQNSGGTIATNGQGVGLNLFPTSLQQAFLGGAPGSTNTDTNGGVIFTIISRTVAYQPAAGSRGEVEVSWQQTITDSTNGARNYFEWIFYNGQGRQMAGLGFANGNRGIWQRLEDNSTPDTGLRFERGRIYDVKVRFNFVDNSWSAVIGTNVLPSRPITTGGLALSLGSMSTWWWGYRGQAPFVGGPVSGDNRIIFDDLLVTASLPEQHYPLVAAGSDWKHLANGSNQGTNWSAANFNDEAWASGPAELGYGDTADGRPEATVISFGPNVNAKYITTYFRRKFVVSNSWTITNLTLGLLRDDGGIVYLNGVEVFRSNLPNGPVNFSTLATNATDDGTVFFTNRVNPALLVEGTNVLAVEIHQQSAASTDISFDLYLNADLMMLLPPTFTQQPQAQTVLQGGAVTFSVAVSGTPPFGYHWLKGPNTLVPFGLGGPTLTLTNVQPADATNYSCVVTNFASRNPGVASSNAILTVIAVPAVTPAVIGVQPGGSVNLSLPVPIGVRVVVEASTDLLSWEVLSDTITSNSVLMVNDAAAALAGSRFYRIKYFLP